MPLQESVDQGAALKENARRTREELEASKLQVEALKIEVTKSHFKSDIV
jgi:hypothetical protein